MTVGLPQPVKSRNHSLRSDFDPGGPHRPVPRRTVAAVFCHAVGRVAFGALCLMFIALICGAGLVAYQDLTGPHCDGHRMGPADTCSILTSRGYRSVRTIEKLNPTGTGPAVLTPPGNWHATQDNTRTGVYSPAGMRGFHRTTGYAMLGFALLIGAILGSWVYKASRARGRSTTTADESHRRT